MKISELALLIQGTVEGDNVDVLGVNGIGKAQSCDLTFAVNEDRLAAAEQSNTACILTTLTSRRSTKPLIRVDNPKFAFLVLHQALSDVPASEPNIHPSAVVSDSVKIGRGVCIGPLVNIEECVEIGDGSIIEGGCVVKKGSVLGDFCRLYPNVVLYENTVLGNHVILHSGVVIGADGFGYVKNHGKIHKFPQLCKVIIKDNVEIGANTCVDKGSLEDTVIGENTKIDNLCHIAHNVKIGRNVVMAAQCGVAGSTVIGDNVTMSGQIAVIDNVNIGNNAVIGGQSGIIGDIDENAVVWGAPARPLAIVKKQMAVLSWLTKNFVQLSKIIKEKN